MCSSLISFFDTSDTDKLTSQNASAFFLSQGAVAVCNVSL